MTGIPESNLPPPGGDAGRPGWLTGLPPQMQTALQLGAIGVLALFIWLGFQLTMDEVKYNRTLAGVLNEELQKQRNHDAAEQEKNRTLLLDVFEKVRANQERIKDNQLRIQETQRGVLEILRQLKS